MNHLTDDQQLRLELVRLFAPAGTSAPETALQAYGFIIGSEAAPMVPTDADSTARVEQALRRARHGLGHPELEAETQLTRDQIDRALKRLEAAGKVVAEYLDGWTFTVTRPEPRRAVEPPKPAPEPEPEPAATVDEAPAQPRTIDQIADTLLSVIEARLAENLHITRAILGDVLRICPADVNAAIALLKEQSRLIVGGTRGKPVYVVLRPIDEDETAAVSPLPEPVAVSEPVVTLKPASPPEPPRTEAPEPQRKAVPAREEVGVETVAEWLETESAELAPLLSGGWMLNGRKVTTVKMIGAANRLRREKGLPPFEVSPAALEEYAA